MDIIMEQLMSSFVGTRIWLTIFFLLQQPPKKDTKQSSKPKDKPSSSGGKAKKKVKFVPLHCNFHLNSVLSYSTTLFSLNFASIKFSEFCDLGKIAKLNTH